MKETSPPRDSRVVAGHSMEMLAAGLARDGVGGAGGALSPTEGRSQSRPTLGDPRTGARSSVRGLSRQNWGGDLDLPAQGA